MGLFTNMNNFRGGFFMKYTIVCQHLQTPGKDSYRLDCYKSEYDLVKDFLKTCCIDFSENEIIDLRGAYVSREVFNIIEELFLNKKSKISKKIRL